MITTASVNVLSKSMIASPIMKSSLFDDIQSESPSSLETNKSMPNSQYSSHLSMSLFTPKISPNESPLNDSSSFSMSPHFQRHFQKESDSTYQKMYIQLQDEYASVVIRLMSKNDMISKLSLKVIHIFTPIYNLFN